MRLPWKRRTDAQEVPTTAETAVVPPLTGATPAVAPGTAPNPEPGPAPSAPAGAVSPTAPAKQLTPAQAMAAAAASPSALASIGAAGVVPSAPETPPISPAVSPEPSGEAASVPIAVPVAPVAPAAAPPTQRRGLIPKWLPWSVGGAVLVIGLVFLAIFLIARSELIRVPSLAGLDRAAAQTRLKELGLTLTVGDRRFSATAPPDTITDQQPAAGTQVSAGTTVRVALSAGSETFAMPDVVGTLLDPARAQLSLRGLAVQVDTAPSDQEQGTVIASVPSAGVDVQTGDTVRLTVAAGAGTTGTLLPTDMTGRTFVLDPEPMPAGSTADTTMDVARRVRALLEASGARVVVTRSATDQGTAANTLARAQRAKDTTSDALVGFSILPSGPEGLAVNTMPNTGSAQTPYLKALSLSQALTSSLKTSFTTIGSGTASDTIVADTGVPAVRLRLGSTASSADKLSFSDSQWADNVAKAVYRAIAQVFGVR